MKINKTYLQIKACKINSTNFNVYFKNQIKDPDSFYQIQIRDPNSFYQIKIKDPESFCQLQSKLKLILRKNLKS
jgi:hypothetical protein